MLGEILKQLKEEVIYKFKSINWERISLKPISPLRVTISYKKNILNQSTKKEKWFKSLVSESVLKFSYR